MFLTKARFDALYELAIDSSMTATARRIYIKLCQRLDEHEFQRTKAGELAEELKIRQATVGSALAVLVDRKYLETLPLPERARGVRSIRSYRLAVRPEPPPHPSISEEAERRHRERQATMKLRGERIAAGETSCRACGRTPIELRLLNLHHVIPISHGGVTCDANCVMLCVLCHREAHCFDRTGDHGEWSGPTRIDQLIGLLRRCA